MSKEYETIKLCDKHWVQFFQGENCDACKWASREQPQGEPSRCRHESALRDVDKQVTELIKIAADVVNRRYLPNLDECRTIRDARAIVAQYDSFHMTLMGRIKKVADSLRALAALKSSEKVNEP